MKVPIFNDTCFYSSLMDSGITMNDSVILIHQETSGKLLFGMPIEFASIVIPTIITIVVFGLGIFIQWRSKKNDRLSMLISFKTVIVEWTKLIGNTIFIQYALYHRFVVDLRNQDNIQAISLINEPFLIDKLNELSLKELIDLMIVNHDGDKKQNALTLLNIVSEIQKLTNIENSIKDKYLEFKGYANSLMEKWNSNFKDIEIYLTNLPSKIATSQNDNEIKFYISLSKTFNDFNLNTDKNITTKIIAEGLIVPLKSICKEFMKINQTSTDLSLILPAINELLLTYYSWKIYKDGVASYFNDSGENIKQTYLLLRDNIDSIEKMRFKKWIRIQ